MFFDFKKTTLTSTFNWIELLRLEMFPFDTRNEIFLCGCKKAIVKSTFPSTYYPTLKFHKLHFTSRICRLHQILIHYLIYFDSYLLNTFNVLKSFTLKSRKMVFMYCKSHKHTQSLLILFFLNLYFNLYFIFQKMRT